MIHIGVWFVLKILIIRFGQKSLRSENFQQTEKQWVLQIRVRLSCSLLLSHPRGAPEIRFLAGSAGNFPAPYRLRVPGCTFPFRISRSRRGAPH